MSAQIPLGASATGVSLVADAAYRQALQGLIASATARLLCSVFIVDTTMTRQRRLPVDDILQSLAEAAWRGVDARLLIGGSRDNIALAEVADAARTRAMAHGLPVRWLTSRKARGSHAKFVIADDAVLSGSHNWSPGALTGEQQTQDSLIVHSTGLCALLASRFETQWLRAQAPYVAV